MIRDSIISNFGIRISDWKAVAAVLAVLTASIAAHADDPRELDRARAAVVRDAVRKASPSIVTIETIGGAQPIGDSPAATQPRAPGARGNAGPSFRVADGPTTGIVWSADGWIVTSAFNFVRDPSVTTILLHGTGGSEPRRLVAKLVARDQIRRIALLKVNAVDLLAAEWSPAGERCVGQYAIACGRGFGGWPSSNAATRDFPDLRLGILSAVGRRNGMAIQTDAKCSPANYGGPLLDIDGRVLGLIVPMGMGSDSLAGVEWYDSGIGFAVTHEAIARVIDRLKTGESLELGKMGVVLADTKDGRCRVRAVAIPSPAQDADLRKGDILISLDGQTVGDLSQVQRKLSDRAAGESVRVQIERIGEAQPLDKTLRLAKVRDIGQPPDEVDEEEEDIKTDKSDDVPGSQPHNPAEKSEENP